jgi:hypothetical protein
MNILSLLGMAPKPVLPYQAGADIASSARTIINNLRSVQNTAQNKGYKVDAMYQKSMHYAQKLETSAAKGKVGSTAENFRKLEKHTAALLPSVQNVFNRSSVQSAGIKLSSIADALDSVRLAPMKAHR